MIPHVRSISHGLLLVAALSNTRLRADADGDNPPVSLNACAQTSTFTAFNLAGRAVTLSQIHEKVPLNGREHSFDELCELATQVGLNHIAVQWPPNANPVVVSPTIVQMRPTNGHTDSAHFAVLLPKGRDEFILVDHPRLPRVLKGKELRGLWTGKALHVSDDPDALTVVQNATTKTNSLSGGIARIAIAAVVSCAVIGLIWFRSRRSAREKALA